MNNDQFVRYKALDRCFRDIYGSYTITDLVEVCSKAVSAFHGDMDRKVAQRTVEKDIEDLRLRYEVKLQERLRLGHKKLYRYEDTSFSLMQTLLADGELEQMMLQNVLDTLSLYDDVPQYKWLYMFLQQRINGIKANETQAIEFQNNPDLMGMEHFGILLNAIINHQPITIRYQKYHREPRDCQVHPYLLKQFNDRWFLIGRTDGFDNLSNYAIDRIQEVSLLGIPFQPAGLDLTEYFEDVIGVSKDNRVEPVDVVIRIKKNRYPYVESKPLHSSQTPLRKMWDDEHCVIRLHVQINNELEASILSLGCDAEVLEPESLRESIKKKIDTLNNMYN